jgi:heat shock protein HslJ
MLLRKRIGGLAAATLLLAACTTPAAPASPTSASPNQSAAGSPAAASASQATPVVAVAGASLAASPSTSVKPAVSPAPSAAVAVALPSPSSAARTGAASLAGTWQWQSTQASNGSSTVVADPTRYTINFQADNSLQIRADCNQVGGTYSVSGSSLTLNLGPSTLAACPPDSQVDQFLAGLGQVTSYTVTGTNLELGLQGGGRMQLSAMAAPTLVGPNWQLLAYNNGRNAVQSVMTGTQPTATFGADGQLSGSGGCNNFSGPYQSSANTLSIGPLASTMMACEQPVMDQETAYLAALERSTTYRFDNGRLVLADAGGATQAEFNP